MIEKVVDFEIVDCLEQLNGIKVKRSKTLRMKLIVIVLFSFLSIGLFGQDKVTMVKKAKIKLTSSLDRMTNSMDFPTRPLLKQRSIFDVKKLAIFCKIEHKLAKSSKINVMMRLGSLDYVNKLEGKTP